MKLEEKFKQFEKAINKGSVPISVAILALDGIGQLIEINHQFKAENDKYHKLLKQIQKEHKRIMALVKK